MFWEKSSISCISKYTIHIRVLIRSGPLVSHESICTSLPFAAPLIKIVWWTGAKRMSMTLSNAGRALVARGWRPAASRQGLPGVVLAKNRAASTIWSQIFGFIACIIDSWILVLGEELVHIYSICGSCKPDALVLDCVVKNWWNLFCSFLNQLLPVEYIFALLPLFFFISSEIILEFF
jgi:hypothetical protein